MIKNSKIIFVFLFFISCFDVDFIQYIKWNPDNSANISFIIFTIFNENNSKKEKPKIEENSFYKEFKQELDKIPNNILKNSKIYFYDKDSVIMNIELFLTNVYKVQPYIKDSKQFVIPKFENNKIIIEFKFLDDFSKSNQKKENQTIENSNKEENKNNQNDKNEEYNNTENNPNFDIEDDQNHQSEEENSDSIEEYKEYEDDKKDEKENDKIREDIKIKNLIQYTNFKNIVFDDNFSKTLAFLNFTYYLILEGKTIKEVTLYDFPDKTLPFFKIGENKYIVILPLIYLLNKDEKLSKKIIIEVK